MRKFFRKTAIFLVAVQIAMLSLPAYNYAAESSHDTGIEASNESLEDGKSKKEEKTKDKEKSDDLSSKVEDKLDEGSSKEENSSKDDNKESNDQEKIDESKDEKEDKTVDGKIDKDEKEDKTLDEKIDKNLDEKEKDEEKDEESNLSKDLSEKTKDDIETKEDKSKDEIDVVDSSNDKISEKDDIDLADKKDEIAKVEIEETVEDKDLETNLVKKESDSIDKASSNSKASGSKSSGSKAQSEDVVDSMLIDDKALDLQMKMTEAKEEFEDTVTSLMSEEYNEEREKKLERIKELKEEIADLEEEIKEMGYIPDSTSSKGMDISANVESGMHSSYRLIIPETISLNELSTETDTEYNLNMKIKMEDGEEGSMKIELSSPSDCRLKKINRSRLKVSSKKDEIPFTCKFGENSEDKSILINKANINSELLIPSSIFIKAEDVRAAEEGKYECTMQFKVSDILKEEATEEPTEEPTVEPSKEGITKRQISLAAKWSGGVVSSDSVRLSIYRNGEKLEDLDLKKMKNWKVGPIDVPIDGKYEIIDTSIPDGWNRNNIEYETEIKEDSNLGDKISLESFKISYKYNEKKSNNVDGGKTKPSQENNTNNDAIDEDGRYTADATFVRDDDFSEESMCNKLFYKEADLRVKGDETEVTLYVIDPIPNFADEGTPVKNLSFKYKGKNYKSKYKKTKNNYKEFEADGKFIDVNGDYPVSEITFTLPNQAIEDSREEDTGIKCSAYVNAVMKSNVKFYLILDNVKKGETDKKKDGSLELEDDSYTSDLTVSDSKSKNTSGKYNPLFANKADITIDSDEAVLSMYFIDRVKGHEIGEQFFSNVNFLYDGETYEASISSDEEIVRKFTGNNQYIENTGNYNSVKIRVELPKEAINASKKGKLKMTFNTLDDLEKEKTTYVYLKNLKKGETKASARLADNGVSKAAEKAVEDTNKKADTSVKKAPAKVASPRKSVARKVSKKKKTVASIKKAPNIKKTAFKKIDKIKPIENIEEVVKIPRLSAKSSSLRHILEFTVLLLMGILAYGGKRKFLDE